MKPSFREEKNLWKKGYRTVAGLDEAGRGPLAGPVVSAAVVVNKKLRFEKSLKGVRDSKLLSAKRREEFYKILTRHPGVKWGVGRASEKMIDKINILEATKLAMKRAVKNLERKGSRPDFLILDGKMELNLPVPQKSIIKADQKVFSCSAASILAKVSRDRIMGKYHRKYPKYGFDRHNGYPTRFHRKMLRKHKPCRIHRFSYIPVRNNMLKYN